MHHLQDVRESGDRLVSLRALPPRDRQFTVALAGNPNSGKSTLFNALTEGDAKVGNYPGVTVERRTGVTELGSCGRVEIIDIPGLYSFNASSEDELLATEEVLGLATGKAPDALVVIVDCLALERSLYLVMQALEFGIPLVVAVNMMDSAVAQGLRIDFDQLTRLFRVPFIPIVARRGDGIDYLRQVLEDTLLEATRPEPLWLWEPNQELAADLDQLEAAVAQNLPTVKGGQRAFALWLLMTSYAGTGPSPIPAELDRKASEIRSRAIEAGRDLDEESVYPRYGFIDGNAPAFVVRAGTSAGITTEKIDAVLTHPLWGSLIFVGVMLLIFQSLFSWAEPFMNLIEGGFQWFAETISPLLPAGFLHDLVIEGAVPGISAVVVFLPQILFLFLFLTVLEGSGYLARTAFLSDRALHQLGLHGKAVVPMISGFACAIPAIMAVRTIENQRDRLLTIMVIPLMSCSARLPVYTLIIAALFPARETIGFVSVGSLMLLAIYLLSTLLAFGAALVLGATVFKGQRRSMLLELPPYRVPKLKAVLRALWERSREFLSTAGKTILVASLIIWLLLSFPQNAQLSRDYDLLKATAQESGHLEEVASLEAQEAAERLRASYGGQMGSMIEPVLRPLGFDWKIGIGLIGAFAAREVFVSTMGVVYGVGDEADESSQGLRDAIRRDRREDGTPLWTPLLGMSLLVFFMIAMQCMSTLAVVRRETKSWKWTLFLVVYLTVLAYTASLLVYQGGRLLGFA